MIYYVSCIPFFFIRPWCWLVCVCVCACECECIFHSLAKLHCTNSFSRFFLFIYFFIQMTMRPEMYAQAFADYIKPDFKPQAVYEPAD